MNKTELELRQEWYYRKDIIFNIIEDMKGKEVVFQSADNSNHTIRGLRIFNTNSWEFPVNRYNLIEENRNILVSLAHYKNIPNFPNYLKIRSEYTSKWFEEQAEKEIIDYDLLFDFDSESEYYFLQMILQIERLLTAFNRCNVCYSIYPSGNNFQVLIEGKDMLKEHDYNLKLTEKIKEVFALSTLCLNGIGSFNKIRKCRYSLVNNIVCIPINNNISYGFSLNVYRMNYKNLFSLVYQSQQDFYKRGLMKVNDNGEIENKKNFEKFKERFLK